MNVCETLKKLLDESFAETLKEKIIYCLGYLEGDDENLDLYELFYFMLYSEKNTPRSTFDLNPIPSLSKYNFSGKRSKCKKCIHYHEDVLFCCIDCSRFNNSSNLYTDRFEEVKNDK